MSGSGALPSLQVLSLAGDQIGDTTGLKELAAALMSGSGALPNLKYLNVSSPPLQLRDVRSTRCISIM